MAGIVLRGRGVVRRFHGREIEVCAGLAVDLGRIDQAIAAHPDLVFGFRQIRHHVAPRIVGDDDLGKLGRQVGGLGDHPHAGLGAAGSANDAANIIGVDGNLGRACGRTRALLRVRRRNGTGQPEAKCCGRDGTQRDAGLQADFRCHGVLPRVRRSGKPEANAFNNSLTPTPVVRPRSFGQGWVVGDAFEVTSGVRPLVGLKWVKALAYRVHWAR